MPDQSTNAIILELLENEALSPRELLNRLRNRGISQADAKESLSYLVNDEQVELTPNSTLKGISAVGA